MRTWTIIMLVCFFATHSPCLGQDLSRDDLWEILRHQNELAERVEAQIPLDEDGFPESSVLRDFYAAILAGEEPLADYPALRQALADYAVTTTTHMRESLPQAYQGLQSDAAAVADSGFKGFGGHAAGDRRAGARAFEMQFVGMWLAALDDRVGLGACTDSALRFWVLLQALDSRLRVTLPASNGYHAVQVFVLLYASHYAVSHSECAHVASAMRELERTNYFMSLRGRSAYFNSYEEDPGWTAGIGTKAELEVWREEFDELFNTAWRLSRTEFDADALQASPAYVEASKNVPQAYEPLADLVVAQCIRDGLSVSRAARFQMLVDLVLLMRAHESAVGSLPGPELIRGLAAGVGLNEIDVIPRGDGYVVGWGEGLAEAAPDRLIVYMSIYLSDPDGSPFVGTWVR